MNNAEFTSLVLRASLEVRQNDIDLMLTPTMSGLLITPALSWVTRVPFVVVRHETHRGHHTNRLIEVPPLFTNRRYRVALVDDAFNTKSTLRYCWEKWSKFALEYHIRSEYVGAILYNSSPTLFTNPNAEEEKWSTA